MIWTIPNILTIGRILAAPCLALVFAVFDRPLADWIALGIFVVAAITDFLDGWLARRLGQVTEIGKMLDPIADKAMVIVGLMVILAHARPAGLAAGYMLSLVLIPAAVIALREVVIAGVREYLGATKLPVTELAKWKTALQLFAVGTGIFVGAFEPGVTRALGEGGQSGADVAIAVEDMAAVQVYYLAGLLTVVSLWAAAILTVLTGWDYLLTAIDHIRGKEAP